MHVVEECRNIAVMLGKSENMRVSAGIRYAALVDLIQSDTDEGRAAVEEIEDKNYTPTAKGVWELITHQPDFPNRIGTSNSVRLRLLKIGAAEDPSKAHQDEIDQDRGYDRPSRRADAVYDKIVAKVAALDDETFRQLVTEEILPRWNLMEGLNAHRY